MNTRPKGSADPTEYIFEEGHLYIGELNEIPLGIKTLRHAITVAGARTGKGVGVINTNLRTWPHNVLVIDPKGEAASVSWEARKNKGQAVHVLDPFKRATVPQDVLASYNPLADLDPNSLTYREDILAIADGTVLRSGDTGAVYWDNGGSRIIAGLIAYVLTYLPPDEQNLISVREILSDQREGGLFEMAISEMENAQSSSLSKMMRAGASAANAKEGSYFISNAEAHTNWLDSEAMTPVLSSSTFSMSDLKRGKASVFVSLPFEMLDEEKHARFLRLMVRCGIRAMQEPMPDGSELGERCLFILDEFFSLGQISEISKAIGGMPSKGLHLWPFLQDMEQLWKLYGQDGAGTFFGSSDLHQFFGISDPKTLDFISNKIGNYDITDLPNEPKFGEGPMGQDYRRTEKQWDDMRKNPNAYSRGEQKAINDSFRLDLEYAQKEYNENLARFNTTASRVVGKPRFSPQAVANLIRLEQDGKTAESQIAFVRGGKPLFCNIGRYFEWDDKKKAPPFPSREEMIANIKEKEAQANALAPPASTTKPASALAPKPQAINDTPHSLTPRHRAQPTSSKQLPQSQSSPQKKPEKLLPYLFWFGLLAGVSTFIFGANTPKDFMVGGTIGAMMGFVYWVLIKMGLW
ncbi:Type IV secretory pathway, VirD4 component, TraG/TraD family ATPase [Roseovarius litoreus]|uniref:Type IV secretory pathway, VirD4 component, TraG/TraD family ATPase n=1 Tax=Roseovarius litoreus TaxID=1155722 RepID=A0A1M7E856_9RHOB|nr:type IV secretory system conjugative DNA transfer family protein [Roseovarius litoreus]SHL87778.1 Type IV secretory pathway, VirD4 component, TraG/TraD family ATPase [Roseovarius litoreus]